RGPRHARRRDRGWRAAAGRERRRTVAEFKVGSGFDPPSGNYRFRWSTSGKHGELSDLLQDGVVRDTDSPDIWYYHNAPVTLSEHHVDSILLEVFIVENGVNQIPPDAKPIGKGQAIVRGAADPSGDCVWECDENGI